MPDTVLCGWPADGHAPPTDEPASWTLEHDHPCQAIASGWFASPQPHTDPIIDVCDEHTPVAAVAGWSVTNGRGRQWGEPLGCVLDNGVTAAGEPLRVQGATGPTHRTVTAPNTGDAELDAMHLVVRALDPLGPDQRARVLRWIAARYVVSAAEASYEAADRG